MSQAKARKRRRYRQQARLRKLKKLDELAKGFAEILGNGLEAMFELERQYAKDIQKAIRPSF